MLPENSRKLKQLLTQQLPPLYNQIELYYIVNSGYYGIAPLPHYLDDLIGVLDQKINELFIELELCSEIGLDKLRARLKLTITGWEPAIENGIPEEERERLALVEAIEMKYNRWRLKHRI